MKNSFLDRVKYSVKTEVKWGGEWWGIIEVWFMERKIRLIGGQLISYGDVEDIRQHDLSASLKVNKNK